MKSAMDFNVDPCHDFYHFACGRYINESVIPEEKTRITSFGVIADKLLENSRILLKSDKDEKHPLYEKPKDMYKACMDEEAIEEAGIKPMEDIIAGKLKGFFCCIILIEICFIFLSLITNNS